MFCGGLPHDLMHDVFEGVVSVEGKLLLTTLINQGFFSYEYYNKALASFPYGYCDSDKPIPVTKRTFHNSDKLHLSASQAILFVRMLPLIIGKKIPENNTHWNCFLLLRKICDILLSPVVSEGLCSTLKDLIRDHHSLYLSLYGDSNFTPKFHFLIHYPSQILAIGPMIRTWTIRYEAKLNFFKQCSRLANFKNISLSLSNRHQHWIMDML